MSEYHDIGPLIKNDRADTERPETENKIQPGSTVNVQTEYVYLGIMQTEQGEKAKPIFKIPDGRTFVRIANFDDLVFVR